MKILNSESSCASWVFCQMNEVRSWTVFCEVSAEYSLLCKQYFGNFTQKSCSISQIGGTVFVRPVLDMDTAVRDSIRYTFIALKSVTVG